MSSPAWGKIVAPVETSFVDIMSEEYAHRVQDQEMKKFEAIINASDGKHLPKAETLEMATKSAIWDDVPCGSNNNAAGGVSYAEATKSTLSTDDDDDDEDEDEMADCSELIKEAAREAAANGEQLSSTFMECVQKDATDTIVCDSDELIALMLQSQFDQEYNAELRRIENGRNKQAKVSISLDKYRRNGHLEVLTAPEDVDDEQEEDEAESQKRDWDRFETNAKRLDTIPKCGFKVDKRKGEMITKHDEELCGVRNACRVMAFPPEFPTGDGAGFEMKLSNQVFNQLKSYSRSNTKKNKMNDRRENVATAEMGVDVRTRLLLYKFINNGILERINGIISTGKEAVILHANSDLNFTAVDLDGNHKGGAFLAPELMPKECAIKIFKTTLNEFKQRDRYIKDDYRFKDRFSKQNNRVIINMWAEKEMFNIMRMKAVGINCPDVVVLKRHVLVMSFIGDNHNAAPKLKDARLSLEELQQAYTEIVESMHKLYNVGKLIHADLSEYNILWHDGKCWFIDVAQSVEPNHPSALEFLMRDCANIIGFFKKRNLPDILTKEQLFEHITALDAKSHNVAMLERIHTRGASMIEATVPNQEDCPDELKPLSFPFNFAWEKSQADKQKTKIDDAASALRVLSIRNGEDKSMECEETTSNIILVKSALN